MNGYCPRCGDDGCQQAVGPCPRYPDVEMSAADEDRLVSLRTVIEALEDYENSDDPRHPSVALVAALNQTPERRTDGRSE